MIPIRNYAGAERPMYAPQPPVHLGTWHYGPATQAPPVDLPAVPTLEMIQRLEVAISDLEPVEIEPVHHFADGMYGREITIPAGTVLTGKIHRGEHLNFLTKGDITVWTEEGMKRLQAPAVIVSKPGTKRVGYAHTDTTWVTVHATQETDLALLEAELIEPEAAIEQRKDSLCLGSPSQV